MTQSKYAKDILVIFQMTDCKPVAKPFLFGVKLEDGGNTPLVDCTMYRQLVGSLLYVTDSHPNLSYVVGSISRYMQEPHELHWKVSKRILRYVKETTSYGIYYTFGYTLDLVGYTDFDWVGDAKDHKSTSGYVLSIGYGPICQSSRKQTTISLSLAEVEYRGVVNTTTQAIWL